MLGHCRVFHEEGEYDRNGHGKNRSVPMERRAAALQAPLLGSEGFEPSKAEPTDLQSAPFDRSGNSPKRMSVRYQQQRDRSRREAA